MSTLGGHVRGYRPGDFITRAEREFFDDPEREAKLLVYEQRAKAGEPLFDAQLARNARSTRTTSPIKRKK